MMKEPGSKDWNLILAGFDNAHFLQTTEWAEIKSTIGWKNETLLWKDENDTIIAAASILQRNIQMKGLVLPFSVIYIPRGPILNWQDKALREKVLQDIKHYAKKRNAIFIKIDPEIELGTGIPGMEDEQPNPTGNTIYNELISGGWKFSQDQIQFKNTVQIDLKQNPDTLLGNMKQKTRYNIRLAEKKNVVIREGNPNDFYTLYRMYAETAIRDGFVIRSREYYTQVWNKFYESGHLTPLIASVDNEDIAGLMLFHFGKNAWYVYGMSLEKHRNRMPTYLLQWHAILKSQKLGCEKYDLWGAPDTFTETDGMWGVFRFKQGLGGTTVRTIGAWDYPCRPFLYWLYLRVLPRLLSVLRKRGRQLTIQSLDG